jgi:NAD(P)-dependent dehydrogenase (short-subunit alcohol dehydrogenase family)
MTHPVTDREQRPAEPVGGESLQPERGDQGGGDGQAAHDDQVPGAASAEEAVALVDESSFVTGATLTVDGGMSI